MKYNFIILNFILIYTYANKFIFQIKSSIIYIIIKIRITFFM